MALAIHFILLAIALESYPDLSMSFRDRICVPVVFGAPIVPDQSTGASQPETLDMTIID